MRACFHVFIIKKTEFEFISSLKSLAAETAVEKGVALKVLPKPCREYVSNKEASPSLFDEKVVGWLWKECEEIPVSEEFDIFLLDEILNRLNLQENEERRDFIENLVNYEANNLIETSIYQMGGPNIG